MVYTTHKNGDQLGWTKSYKMDLTHVLITKKATTDVCKYIYIYIAYVNVYSNV